MCNFAPKSAPQIANRGLKSVHTLHKSVQRTKNFPTITIMNFDNISKPLAIAFTTLSTLTLAALFGLWATLTTFSSSEKQIICIKRGAEAAEVKALVSNNASAPKYLAFNILASLTGYYDHIRPGRYDVGSSASTLEVFRAMRNGSESPLRLTIRLVRTVDDLAEFLGEELEPSAADFEKAILNPKVLAELGLTPENAISLFIPNTYEVYWSTTAEDFVKRIKRENDAFWTEERTACIDAIDPSCTKADVITLASIVEQETQYAPERPNVAGMYINRLHKGMPLQADPTVKFALGDFAIRRVTAEHLKVESPYNTYRVQGLPPGPICIPSVSSIDAVLHYAHHNYLYMCAKEDFSGSHNFAATYSEHMANAARYRNALDKRNIH